MKKNNQCDNKKMKEQLTRLVAEGTSPGADTALGRHLSGCSFCREEWERLREVMNMLAEHRRPEMPTEFWDSYYERLEARLDRELAGETTGESVRRNTRGTGYFRLSKPWIMIPAAAVLLAATLWLGQWLLAPGKGGIFNSAIRRVQSLAPALSAHFDNMQPVLLDYANYSDSAGDGPVNAEPIMMDRKTVERLLLENELLKRSAARQKNLPLKKLLDDYDIILTELANCENDEERQAIAASIRDFIGRNNLLVKMDMLKDRSYRKNTASQTERTL